MGKERFSKTKSFTPLKITIIGSSAVGKTSLVLSYKNSKFVSNDGDDFEPGTDDYGKVFALQGIEIPVIICDSLSRREYKHLRPLAYKDTDCFVMCYAINNASTFADIERDWVPLLKKNFRRVPHILVGTKLDTRKPGVEAHRFISKKEGEVQQELVKANSFMEISSKEMVGLDTMFTEAAQLAFNYRCGNRGSCVLS